MTWDTRIKLSALREYFGLNFFLISSFGWVISTPFCDNVIAKANPSSGVFVMSDGSQLAISSSSFVR